MAKDNDDFQRRLLATFRVEAEEHLQAMSNGLIELEKARGAGETQIAEKIAREAHSLKGAARAVNHRETEDICQALESVLTRVKRHELAVSAEVFDILHGATDGIAQLLAAHGSERTAPAQSALTRLVQRLESLSKSAVTGDLPSRGEDAEPAESATESPPRPAGEKAAASETIRISASRLDLLLLQVEELLSAKLGMAQRAADLRELAGDLALWKRERAKVQAVGWTTHAGTGAPGNGDTKRLLEFLEWNDVTAKKIEHKVRALARSSEHDLRSLGSMMEALLRDTKRLLMLPFSSLTEVFPKLARDISREQGKELDLVIRGADIEIDRRILQEIKDPLVHLVRNCIDHGIETPEARRRKNKPPKGIVTLAMEQKSGNKVEILVSDDGVGIDVSRVKASGVKLGLLSPEAAEKASLQEALNLIFQSGVSTSPIVTSISGRGLGMAIVREKVERLGGVVAVETRPDFGTSFRIILPLALSTFRGLLVRAAAQSFLIPTVSVERVASAKREELQTVEGRETLLVGGQAVAVVRLQDALELSEEQPAARVTDRLTFVVIDASGKRIAFLVDEVLGEQEVLVKGLGPQLARVRNIGGAAVLGTGKVVPILNVTDLMKSAVDAGTSPVRSAGARAPESPRQKSVLVVDDSITARTLLKNILESAGYAVTTAVDGAEAFATLREAACDLVVSDVDMPRMNGFDLTTRIRADKKLSELPVVLVTALESRQDRERGIDVGANAYIVKSSFEQNDLLQALSRLL